jgi:5-methylcytosine-specific restriction endonuclease McrA
MSRKKHPTISIANRIDLAIARCSSVRDGIAMGGSASLEKELNSINELVKHLEEIYALLQKHELDKPVISQIKEIETRIDFNRKQKSFFQTMFSNNDEFKLEEDQVKVLRKRLLLDYGFNFSIKHREASSTSLEQSKTQLTALKNYCVILQKSIVESKKRATELEVSKIKNAELKIEKEKQKEAENKRIKALAAAHTGKTRQLATNVKNQLKQQTSLISGCPYCGGSLGETPHADHIYPVARGGLSTADNMIYVCQRCNIKKSDKTVYEFVREAKLNLNQVLTNIEILGKRV